MDKPDGLPVLGPGDLPGPLLALGLDTLPRVGKPMSARLKRDMIATIKDFWNSSPRRSYAKGGATSPTMVTIRLLMLTECRKSEILTFCQEGVALGNRLPDTKQGTRVISMLSLAAKLLGGLSRLPFNPWVIPGKKLGTHFRKLDDVWNTAGLYDVRLHDLCHSFSCPTLALGEELPMLGKLLCSSRSETMARYVHLTLEFMRESSERVVKSVADDIMGEDRRLVSGS